MNDKEDDIKEPFCPVCIAAVPLAFSVTAGAASTTIEEKKRRYEIMKWCTIAGIISIFIILYFWLVVKCESCA